MQLQNFKRQEHQDFSLTWIAGLHASGFPFGCVDNTNVLGGGEHREIGIFRDGILSGELSERRGLG